MNIGCTENQFQCKDGKCIDIEAKCDREYDCVDESDEHECGKTFRCFSHAIQYLINSA